MAKRYCGSVTIELTYSELGAVNGTYRCRISSPVTAPRKPYIITVAAPRYLDTAVDSAEAYDAAAHAALSFLAASAETEWKGNHLCASEQVVSRLVSDFDPTSWTGRGWKVCRRAIDALDSKEA